MTEKLFNEVIAWQKATFPGSTALSKLSHLREELDELEADLKSDSPARWLEFADCFLLLFGCAAADGMSYNDIQEIIEKKLLINRSRKWGSPDEHGVVRHTS
ncbi:MAG: DUF550 domain-containing protein [Flavobacteriales bacterium]|nr:DUF550 domain-containing protein [Flavobacteriales bacterium]